MTWHPLNEGEEAVKSSGVFSGKAAQYSSVRCSLLLLSMLWHWGTCAGILGTVVLLLPYWGHRKIQAGKDLRRSLVQPPGEERELNRKLFKTE